MQREKVVHFFFAFWNIGIARAQAKKEKERHAVWLALAGGERRFSVSFDDQKNAFDEYEPACARVETKQNHATRCRRSPVQYMPTFVKNTQVLFQSGFYVAACLLIQECVTANYIFVCMLTIN